MQLSQILREQKIYLEEYYKNRKIIDREAIKNKDYLVNSNLIKIITGIRRSGKSTFLYSILKDKNYAYINFDDPLLYNIDQEELYKSIFEAFGNINIIFFDEIQNLNNWELFVNRLYREGYNIFITGSNSRLLSRELSTNLTGRHIPFELYPFSFREYLFSKNIDIERNDTKNLSIIKNELNNYIEIGGFPEILVNNENPRIYLRTLFYDIINKDVIRRYNIRYEKTIEEIALYLLNNYSRYFSYNSIKNNFDIKSVHTVKNYINYLEESYLFLILNKYSFSNKEILISDKKVYLIDTGFANVFYTSITRDIGRLIENIVAIELFRRRSYDFEYYNIYYFKDYQQHEVDFVIKEGNIIKQLIQVSYINSRDELDKREIRSLIKASNLLNCNDLLIISWDYEDNLKIDNKEIKAIPLWKWLLNF